MKSIVCSIEVDNNRLSQDTITQLETKGFEQNNIPIKNNEEDLVIGDPDSEGKSS